MLAEIFGIRVGLSKSIITPTKPVFLAGLGYNRMSKGVHDDLYVRTAVISNCNKAVAIVGVDSIGLMYNYVKRIQKEAKEKYGVKVIVGSSHCHSTPDTIGLWGPNQTTSGVDKEYLDFLSNKILDSIGIALKNVTDAEILVGRSKLPLGVAKNTRDPNVIDEEISYMLFKDASDKKELGFLVNFGLHPEVLWNDNLLITADYVYYLLKYLEENIDGIGVFLNGSLGGMVTPDVKTHTFEEAERVGITLAKSILDSIRTSRVEYEISGDIKVLCKKILLPVSNENFIRAAKFKIISREFLDETYLESELCCVAISSAVQIVTLPGEPLPKVGLKVKSLLRSPYKLLIGLGNDEIGYIIDKEDWNAEKYEESMSLGPLTVSIVLTNIKALIGLC
ncbi:neutral/alkaline non-lysosomal ceramidase N-terminal domain-containing protein [archaeon]|nr:neutral/alkaline non-lysosomal ceramidase N-terminal domain-containing protein [archaeon]